MDFQIPTDRLRFIVAQAAVQRRDFESGALKTTPEGAPLFAVGLLAMDGAAAAPIRVTVAGEPGVGQGQFVVPRGLTLHVIERRGDSVMWWTADRLEVEPGGGETPGVKPGPRGKTVEQ